MQLWMPRDQGHYNANAANTCDAFTKGCDSLAGRRLPALVLGESVLSTTNETIPFDGFLEDNPNREKALSPVFGGLKTLGAPERLPRRVNRFRGRQPFRQQSLTLGVSV